MLKLPCGWWVKIRELDIKAQGERKSRQEKDVLKDYTGQVMQVLLLLLINSVNCYVNVLHGMSMHRANVQGSWDYSLNKDVAQTAWNGVCVSVPCRVMMDANRTRMNLYCCPFAIQIYLPATLENLRQVLCCQPQAFKKIEMIWHHVFLK